MPAGGIGPGDTGAPGNGRGTTGAESGLTPSREATLGRVFFLTSNSGNTSMTLTAYDSNTFLPLGSVTLPGITGNTTPTDYHLNKQFQMMKFDGERWIGFGPIIDASKGSGS